MPTRHFGKWLKRAITDIPMNLTEFAREVGVSREVVCRWTASPRPGIRPDNIVRIARVLGITREDVEAQLGVEPAPAAA